MSELNSKNIIGWLELLVDICPLDYSDRDKIVRFINRKDKKRRQKELEEVFNG